VSEGDWERDCVAEGVELCVWLLLHVCVCDVVFVDDGVCIWLRVPLWVCD
jgi:hypothetical protein